MLKKLATVIMASAFAMAVYAPSVSACPGSDMEVADKEKKDDKKQTKKVAKKTKKKSDKKTNKKGDKKKTAKKTNKG
jgi:hypothetical protein